MKVLNILIVFIFKIDNEFTKTSNSSSISLFNNSNQIITIPSEISHPIKQIIKARFLLASKDDDDSFADDITAEIAKFLFLHSNISIFIKDFLQNTQCNATFQDILVNGTNLTEIINNSAKSLSDIGLEGDCVNSGLHYLFVEFRAHIGKLLNNTEYYYLYTFLNQSSFFSGLCLPKGCEDFYNNFLDWKINKKFFAYMYETHGIYRITNYSNQTILTNEFFPCLLIYLTATYILFKIVCSLLGLIVFGFTGSGKDDSGDSDDDNSEESDISINENSQGYKGTYIFSRGSNCNSSRTESSIFKNCFYKLWKVLSFTQNLNYLISLKNKYYNDSGLVYISYFRIVTVFWYIFNHNVYALIKIPHKNYTNYNFFTSIWFAIIKYSTFSSECWVMLNGVVLAYNLMTYIKNYKINNPSISRVSITVYLKFYFFFLTKTLIFLYTFLVIHVYLDNMTFLGDSPILKYFLKEINNKRTCYSDPWSIFIPFYFQYEFSQTDSNLGFRNCFRYVNFLLNELYCLTIVIIIFFIIDRVKSHILDILLSLAVLVNIAISWLSYAEDWDQGQIYNFNFILGDVHSLSYTHLFFNSYFLGILVGMVYFYYKDVVSSNTLREGEQYIPFRFTYNLMKFLDRRSKRVKKIIFYLSFFLQILLSMSFYFFIIFYSDDPSSDTVENNFTIKINSVIFFFYVYEKKVFLLLFGITMLMFLLTSKVTPLKLFLNSNIFVPVNRIDTSLLCVIDSCVYLFYCIYNLEIYLNLQNMFLLTAGLHVFISIIAIVFWTLFELPLRMAYVNLFTTGKNGKSIKSI